jgi:hypothetical protein
MFPCSRYHPEDFKQRKAYVLDMDVPRIPAEDFADALGDGLLSDPVTETRKRVTVQPPSLAPGMIPLIDKFQPVAEVCCPVFFLRHHPDSHESVCPTRFMQFDPCLRCSACCPCSSTIC